LTALLAIILACTPAAAVADSSAISNASGVRRNLRLRNATKRAIPRDWTGSISSTDCNANGIADENEIEACNGSAACDDCNLNGQPDECDIAGGTSSDVDLDGIPDECVTYDDGGIDDHWSTNENWDDDESPNNQPEGDGFSATVATFQVVLDESVSLNTLRLHDGTTLQVLGTSTEDLEVEQTGGLQLASDGFTQSVLLVGNGRNIDVSNGLVHIKEGGLFEGESVVTSTALAATTAGQCAGSSTASGNLLAGDLLIDTKCGATAPGEMSLSGAMSVDVIGDAVIDARKGCVACALCPAVTSSAEGVIAGGETPPILCMRDMAGVTIGGDLVLLGPAALYHTSTEPLVIGGSFVNESTCPDCVVITGPMVLGSGTALQTAGTLVQSYEVSTLDAGAAPDSYQLKTISTMEIASGASIRFEDIFANQPSGGDEALYVDTLVLRANASVTVSGCTVYYKSLVDEGATIDTINGGALRQIVGVAAIPAASTWGLLVSCLFLLIAGSILLMRRGVKFAPPRAAPGSVAHRVVG